VTDLCKKACVKGKIAGKVDNNICTKNLCKLKDVFFGKNVTSYFGKIGGEALKNKGFADVENCVESVNNSL